MAAYAASEDLETGEIELSIPIKKSVLKALVKRLFITSDMRELADFGDLEMRELIEVADFLKRVAEEE
jgi:hypothetical protein